MIINLRGTHGSGKSTIVRKVMEKGEFQPHFVEGRKRPLAYYDHLKTLFIPGHYEKDCGGCDTILEVEHVFDIVKNAAGQGWSVLFEGILAQHSAPRLIEVAKLFPPVIVIILTTPLEACVKSVLERRAASGNDKPLNQDNIRREFRSVESAARRLRGEGLDVRSLSRNEAFDLCLKELYGPA